MALFWHPKINKENIPNPNDKFLELKGELDTKTAQITLIKFLKSNLKVAVKLLTGLSLYGYQLVTLKGMLNNNFSMCVWSRGAGKSFIAALFCIIFLIFNPGEKIVIAGPTFRTARLIYEEMERIITHKEAAIARGAFDPENSSKRSDLFQWKINGGSVISIPLSSDRVRGFRATVLLIDEFLLLNKDIVERVLMPFLLAPQNQRERSKIRDYEDRLIKEGKMSEEDKMIFKSNSKMICLSSASYTFEHLYEKYCDWRKKIQEGESGETTYFISQFSWEALPPDQVEKSVIDEAKNGGSSHSNFKREYGAQFVDDSEGYFSAKKMKDLTAPDGVYPTLRLVGEKGKKYILSIDPNLSNSPTADFFAMMVLEMDDSRKEPIVVHNYGVAGADLGDHIKYFTYLNECFNIVLIIVDNAGGNQFLQAVNLSEHWKKKDTKFGVIDWEHGKEGQDYVDMVKKCRAQYNTQTRRICVEQVFNQGNWIRDSNEYLQASFDHKRIWFGSKLRPIDNVFDAAVASAQVAINPKWLNAEKHEDFIGDMIDNQDHFIDQVKKQCALIEVRAEGVGGNLVFDLPSHLRKGGSKTKARKDNYSALLLGNWGNRIYYELMTAKEKTQRSLFIPRFIG